MNAAETDGVACRKCRLVVGVVRFAVIEFQSLEKSRLLNHGVELQHVAQTVINLVERIGIQTEIVQVVGAFGHVALDHKCATIGATDGSLNFLVLVQDFVGDRTFESIIAVVRNPVLHENGVAFLVVANPDVLFLAQVVLVDGLVRIVLGTCTQIGFARIRDGIRLREVFALFQLASLGRCLEEGIGTSQEIGERFCRDLEVPADGILGDEHCVDVACELAE